PGAMLYQTQVPRRSESSSPTVRRTLRWWETVGCETSARSARSHTHDSPRGSAAIAESIRRRNGSARALRVPASVAATSWPRAVEGRGTLRAEGRRERRHLGQAVFIGGGWRQGDVGHDVRTSWL